MSVVQRRFSMMFSTVFSSPLSLVVFAMMLLLLSSACRKQQSVSATFVGTYYSRFPAFGNLSLTSLTSEPTSVAPSQAFHIHQFSPLPDFAGFTPVPIMMAPICIAYNATNVVGHAMIDFDISLQTLGAWMRGTDFNTSLSDHSQLSEIGTSQFRLVLAQNAPTTRAVLQRMKAAGVPGFTSATTLPTQVLANPNITWVADDFAAVDMMHAGDGSASRYGLVTFISLAFGQPFPCASIICPTNGGRQTRLADPISLASAEPNLFSLDSSSPFNFTYNFAVTAATNVVIYPLFGTVFLSYPNNPTCADGARSRAAINFVHNLYTSSSFLARMKKWGMLVPSALPRREVIAQLVSNLPCTSFVAVRAGGSGITNFAMAQWTLMYCAMSQVLINFAISNSSVGLQRVASHQYGFGALREPITSPEFPQTDPAILSLASNNKNLRVFPISAMAVSVVFNIPGVNSLTLPLCSILALFNGTITTWSDPILQQYNPEITMPDSRVHIIATTNESATTDLFTHALAEIGSRCNFQQQAAGAFKSQVQGGPIWPFHVDTAVNSDDAVADLILTTPCSIAILATPAVKMDTRIQQAWTVNETTAALSNPSQDLVLESLDLVTIRDYVAADLNKQRAVEAANGYPFFGLNYMVFEDNQGADNCGDLRNGLEFFMWVMTSEKGRAATTDAGFIPLPSHLSANGVSKLIDAKCGGLYVFPLLRTNTSSFELSEGAIAGIAMGSATLIIILASTFAYLYLRGKKSSRHAAKDSDVPMALIFTDIQSSTSLWSIAPQAMAASLDLHNEIIDRNIEKCSGYKVKTIGDAYMICVKDIKKAHQLCLDIQRDLHNADWPFVEIDIAYAEVLQDEQSPYQRYGLDGKELPNPGNCANYAPLLENRLDQRFFRGLAVRIGMTWGCAEPREDPVTGAYDYFGKTVCESSRCESIGNGGMTIYSESAIEALQDADVDLTDAKHVSVTSLGKQPLKGIPAPVELFQVLPPELAGRRFPPLRLDSDGGAMNQQIDEENNITSPEITMTASTVSDARIGASIPSSSSSTEQHSDTSLGEDANPKVPADFRFARYLARIDRQQPKIYLFLSDALTIALAAAPKEAQRKEMIKKIATDWRVQDFQAKPHLYFKKELGYEAYWIMRIVQKISSAIRLRQEKRDPQDTLQCCLTFDTSVNAHPFPNTAVMPLNPHNESGESGANHDVFAVSVTSTSNNNGGNPQKSSSTVTNNNINSNTNNNNNNIYQHQNSAPIYNNNGGDSRDTSSANANNIINSKNQNAAHNDVTVQSMNDVVTDDAERSSLNNSYQNQRSSGFSLPHIENGIYATTAVAQQLRQQEVATSNDAGGSGIGITSNNNNNNNQHHHTGTTNENPSNNNSKASQQKYQKYTALFHQQAEGFGVNVFN